MRQTDLAERRLTIRRRVKHRLKGVGTSAIALVYRVHMWLVWRTARIEVVGLDRVVEAMRRHERIALAVWHENLIIGGYAVREFRPTTLASKSDIGDAIAKILEGLDCHVFRGGSSRGKSRRSPALEAMVAYFKSHRDILMALTVDGSAGPARKLKPGVIALAQQAQSPICVMHCACRPAIHLKTWDRTRVPLVFGKIVIVLEGPVPPPDEGIRGFRQARDQTDLLLHDTCKRAESYLKTGKLPPADPALALDTSYGEGDIRRGRSFFGKGTPPINPRPVDDATATTPPALPDAAP